MKDESGMSRRTFVAGTVAAGLALSGKPLFGMGNMTTQESAAGSAGSGRVGNQGVTKADIDRLMTELSNWGRWGKDDQLGTMNLITPEKRKHAASLVREGRVISLSQQLSTVKSLDNESPMVRATSVSREGARDTYTFAEHGNYFTHLDALCHQFWDGKIYNGLSGMSVVTNTDGASKLSIDVLKDGIFGRGILMDIPRLKGLPYLEPETPIYPEDLDAWEKKAHIKFTGGEIIFIRTGRWGRRAKLGGWDQALHSAGLTVSCARWLKERDIAVLASDNVSDIKPSGIEGVSMPIHKLVLIAMGAPMVDNCDLEELSEATNRRQSWEFLVTMAPMRAPGGTGSPINPTVVL